MGTTSELLLPYPELTDPADVPADLRELAERLDLILPGPVTSLPASPADGQEVHYAPFASDRSVKWHLRYNASSPHADKWEFLGGSPYHSGAPIGSVATASTTFVALTSGPTVTVPNGGVYRVSWITSKTLNVAGLTGMFAAIGIGTTILAGLFSSLFTAAAANEGARMMGEGLVTLAAASALQLIVRCSAANQATFAGGALSLEPLRIS